MLTKQVLCRVVETLLVDDGVLLQRIFSNVVLLSDHMTDFDLGRRSFIQFVSRKNERKKQKEESPGNAQNSVELAPAAGHPNTS